MAKPAPAISAGRWHCQPTEVPWSLPLLRLRQPSTLLPSHLRRAQLRADELDQAILHQLHELLACEDEIRNVIKTAFEGSTGNARNKKRHSPALTTNSARSTRPLTATSTLSNTKRCPRKPAHPGSPNSPNASASYRHDAPNSPTNPTTAPSHLPTMTFARFKPTLTGTQSTPPSTRHRDPGCMPNGDLSVRRFARGSTTIRISAPGRNRTCDLSLRRRTLYPLSYGRRSRLV
jgi:hypothetical protein